MGSTIPVVEKKDFLKWFLKEYQLKKRECAWLLNYLISDDNLMAKVHFVEKADSCPKALIISANDVEAIPFSFHKYHKVAMDAEKAFHDIRLNDDEEIYIQLNFSGAKSNPNYIAVLEDNPFLPENKEVADANREMAEQLVSNALLQFRRKQLAEEIDEALDQKDEQRFHMLVKELNELSRS
ncbi:ReoY family proteolytic degradation factor [Halalkalibacterium ligniniphilum]|uniref:ReoY family proteolytic degradation factor n=1 Tax=Halalkalibacterium ligniniphilum TaxID=1134413 RepID=UPI000347F167|nr:ReoY family proteolytic degradation factor [Halalkalibacterium ligniniphilum]